LYGIIFPIFLLFVMTHASILKFLRWKLHHGGIPHTPYLGSTLHHSPWKRKENFSHHTFAICRF
jgi:hypothetical protein